MIAPVGLEVCDGGDWLGVMKKVNDPLKQSLAGHPHPSVRLTLT